MRFKGELKSSRTNNGKGDYNDTPPKMVIKLYNFNLDSRDSEILRQGLKAEQYKKNIDMTIIKSYTTKQLVYAKEKYYVSF